MGTNTIFLRRHLLWQWHGLAETLMLRKLIRPCDRPWQAVGSHLNQQRSVAHLFVKPSPDDWCKGLTEIVYAWPLLYTIYHPIFLISLLSLLNTT